jgi:hypothetical protein
MSIQFTFIDNTLRDARTVLCLQTERLGTHPKVITILAECVVRTGLPAMYKAFLIINFLRIPPYIVTSISSGK